MKPRPTREPLYLPLREAYNTRLFPGDVPSASRKVRVEVNTVFDKVDAALEYQVVDSAVSHMIGGLARAWTKAWVPQTEEI